MTVNNCVKYEVNWMNRIEDCDQFPVLRGHDKVPKVGLKQPNSWLKGRHRSTDLGYTTDYRRSRTITNSCNYEVALYSDKSPHIIMHYIVNFLRFILFLTMIN